MTGQQCRGKIGIDGTVKNVVANQQSTTAPKIVWIRNNWIRSGFDFFSTNELKILLGICTARGLCYDLGLSRCFF